MHSGMGAGAGGEAAYVARFVREARAAARLSHPNVVSVYDQGEDDGSPYLVMELVPGHTLRDTITAQSPMAPQRALAILEPVLAALAAAHRAGLVHRDVKPENVLISDETPWPERSIKVADFGLARAVTADTQHTSTGVLIGTVSYLAPEIVTEGRADARADVYAAGVLLYELLTGRKPHEGETAIQVAYKHVHEDVPPPSRLVPGLPPYVDALVARATARDAGLRPADAGVLLRQTQRVSSALAAGMSEDDELTADLALPARVSADTLPQQWDRPEVTRTVVRPQGPPATTPPTPPPPTRSPRRRRGPLLVAVAVLLVAAVAVGAWWFGYARYTSTPAVLGLTQEAASSRLAAAGLDVEVGTPAYSDTVAAGRVLRTDPAAGDRVLDGGTVTVTISKGVEQYRLPDLAGKTLDQAQDALGALKMTYGQAVPKWSDAVPKGQVIRTDPAAGATLRPGTSVDVWVSNGRQPVKVADWTGKSAAKAESALVRAGLEVSTDRQYDDDVPSGQVISQSPAPGTMYKGDTVSLLVSRGPRLVEVPRVTGQGVGSATDELEAAGFEVRVRHYTPYFGLGFVMKQEHAGDKVAKGSPITVWVS
jgi:serine/threonine-protein kinase